MRLKFDCGSHDLISSCFEYVLFEPCGQMDKVLIKQWG